MPTPVTTPPVGIKHSENPVVSKLLGAERVVLIRPTAADPSKYENVTIAATDLAPALTLTQQLTDTQQQLLNGSPLLPGVEYLLLGDWDATGDSDQVVAVHAADAFRFRAAGTLYRFGQPPTEVLVDVAAGTTRAIGAEALTLTHDIYAIADNTTVVAAVVGGTFTNGELQGAQPAGSTAGDEFTTSTYGYKFQRGASGSLVWCRYPKG